MDTELDWASLIDEALEEARQGDARPVPGAKLRLILARLSDKRGVDLSEVVRANGTTFAGFLEQKSPELLLLRRPGTDMLVAKSAEEIPTEHLQGSSPSSTRGIRQDLFQALTYLGADASHCYDRIGDRVVSCADSDSGEMDLVPLPPVSLHDHIRLRRSFAQERAPDLEAALLNERLALGAFRLEVQRRGLFGDWHLFQYEALRRKLIDWAAHNHVAVQQSWFEPGLPSRERPPGMAELLKLVADYMTEDELKELRIPLRVFHDLWIAQSRRRT
jgi:hypothetical protein